MKYTGPKFKLCRREQANIFGSQKYNVKKNRSLPGQHGGAMQRLSEYWKLLRNKQLLKRTYLLSEKQFARIVKEIASKISKNKWISHDVALYQSLESRFDCMVYRAWFAKSITQARQMVNHGHFLLNGVKHNIPSTFLKPGDKIIIKTQLQDSVLYNDILTNLKVKSPSWIKIDKNSHAIEVLTLPQKGELWLNADLLKTIEFYARA